MLLATKFRWGFAHESLSFHRCLPLPVSLEPNQVYCANQFNISPGGVERLQTVRPLRLSWSRRARPNAVVPGCERQTVEISPTAEPTVLRFCRLLHTLPCRLLTDYFVRECC